MDSKERAKRFREAREKIHESLRTVDEKTGISKSTIQKLEKEDNTTKVNYIDICTLADYYGVNVAWLMVQSGSSPSLDESSQAVTKATGLTSEAVEQIRSLSVEEKDCLNALLASYDFRRALFQLSCAKTVSKRIEQYKPPKPEYLGKSTDIIDNELIEYDDYLEPPQSADEEAEMIEKANYFELGNHGKAQYEVGTGNNISDRQLVQMYRYQGLQYMGNAFTNYAPADEDERMGK